MKSKSQNIFFSMINSASSEKNNKNLKEIIRNLIEKDVIDTFFKDELEIKLSSSIFLNQNLENKLKIVIK